MYSLNDLENKCILFFKQENCIKCKEQLNILENESLSVPLVILNEENGCVLAQHFSVYAVPVLIYIENGEEVNRKYGVNNIVEIEKMID